jgi:hypothetical protein
MGTVTGEVELKAGVPFQLEITVAGETSVRVVQNTIDGSSLVNPVREESRVWA